ncbi:MAG: TIM barrel protein [Desulfobacterales bacterium]|nr:MAG: TIM barrel protein [Desulfobacterales bacterium]
MKLGTNLSFAIKRWIDGPQLAEIVKSKLGLQYVQYTWDLSDPWWPADKRDKIAVSYAKAFKEAGITIESTFGGLASYAYNHFLAPTEEMRALGFEHFQRAIDMTSAMEVAAAGMPFGSFSYSDAKNAQKRDEIYKIALAMIVKLARHAKEKGLATLLIEPVPLATEFPATAAEALKMMNDLDGQTDIPVRLLVDWGHALYKPLFKENANMDIWMEVCGKYIHSFHIQQTDGSLDCHWSFTRDGLVTPQGLHDFWRKYNLDTQTFFLEIIYPFEADDDFVLEDMIKTADIVRIAA